MTSPSRRRASPPTSSPLPPLYLPWVQEALGGLPADEQTATCQSCAMLPPDGGAAEDADALFFDPRSKCCTYIPELPNFLVGRILLDTTPESAPGRASIVARIETRLQVTPLGLGKPPDFAVLYRTNTSELFGRAVGLRCPHYLADSGGCGIWRHRMSTCGTWFCKYDRGDVGRQAWDSIRQLLRVVERALAVHCVRTLAPQTRALKRAQAESPVREPHLRAADLGGQLDANEHRAIWGSFAGHELGFFEACGRIAGHLSWSDLRSLGGAELDLAVDVARSALEASQSRALPKAVRLAPITVSAVDADAVVCNTYSPFDPLTLPRVLFDLLHLFDGRPTSQALAAISRAGLDLDRKVVRKLLDHGALVDATPSA